MDRRSFLRAGLALAATAVVRPELATAASGPGPYGPLRGPDQNGLLLPSGFRSRVVGVAGRPVAETRHRWHTYPDGGATFAAGDGGWVYVSNSEVGRDGGVGAVRFARDGSIRDAYRILSSTSRNCSGGPTPWGTWLSCEERSRGQVWECDPLRPSDGSPRPALGVFEHEAAAVDPERRRVYMTEDKWNGCLYRFTPAAYPALAHGQLDVALVDGDGRVTWKAVPDPNASSAPTREQVPGATRFNRGEGAWFDRGMLWFTTTGNGRVWALDAATDTLRVVYDQRTIEDPVLTGVDNLTMARSGDLYVAEDGANMELVMLTPEGGVVPFCRLVGHDGSEVAGPAFNPSGTRLYLSSQRGGPDEAGMTFEISGPFRGPSSTRRAALDVDRVGNGDGGGDLTWPLVGTGLAGLGAALVAGLHHRRRAGPD